MEKIEGVELSSVIQELDEEKLKAKREEVARLARIIHNQVDEILPSVTSSRHPSSTCFTSTIGKPLI